MSTFPYFKFNTSTNPFAYIRNEDDVEQFIINIQDAVKEINISLTKQEITLIKLAVIFLINDCRPSDNNIKSIIKLLNTAPITDDSCLEETTIFEIILRGSSVNGLYEKYVQYKWQYLDNSCKTHNSAIEKCIDCLVDLQEEKLLKDLIKEEFPTQATLYTEENKYELWFEPCNKVTKFEQRTTNIDEPIQILVPYICMKVQASETISSYFNVKVEDYKFKNLLNEHCQEIQELLINTQTKQNDEQTITKTSQEFDDSCFDDPSVIEHFSKGIKQ